jgi:polyvinyl alcohol dehydrogenase (cytochrome)
VRSFVRSIVTRLGVGAVLMAMTVPAGAQTPTPRPSGGAALFEQHCASCHLTSPTSDDRVPSATVLRQRSPQAIVDALTVGVMRQQGGGLAEAERRAIADFLGSAAASAAASAGSGGQCTAAPRFAPGVGAQWPAWSPTADNTRLQPAAAAGLTPDQVPRLTLKWAFGFPNATSARALPTVFGGRVFVGSQDGTVYALDAASGCTYWTFRAKAGVRTAVTIGWATTPGPVLAYFGDGRSNVYALNAATGALVWSRSVEEHPASRVTGSLVEYQGRLYVPVASGEEGQGNNPKYACCTFRGSLVALNASTGALVWKTYTIDNEPRPIGTNRGGATRFGPSGAGIWSSPTIDSRRRLIYAATGNMYTEPQQPTSDAVIAFEMDSGKIAWVSQVTPKDVFVVGCNQPGAANCPAADALGPDFDFGNSPMLVTRPDGRQAIVIGQKSGVGWALDPDDRGAVLWQYKAGEGSALGGMEFGSAADTERAYFGVADGNRPSAGELHAVRLDSGQRAWRTLPRPTLCGERGRGCSPAILAALCVIPGAVFAGSQDGGIRAYASNDGSLLWEFDTNREFTTVNGVKAAGASINGPGPVVAGGMVYVNSGYGALGGRPGNVLLAFGLE